jgi:hypothetical protein
MTNRTKKIEAALGINNETPTIASQQGYKFVHRARYEGKALAEEEETTEQITVADFQGEPTGTVTVGAHVTKNLGNYESAKVTVEISLPCLASYEEAVRVYGELNELVSDMIAEQVEGIKK